MYTLIKILIVLVALVGANCTFAGSFPFNCAKKISEHTTAPILGKWVVTQSSGGFKVGGVIEYKLDGTSVFDITGRTTGPDAITVRLKGEGVWKRKGALLATSVTQTQAAKMIVEVTGIKEELPPELLAEAQRDIQKIALEIILTPRGNKRSVMDHPSSQILDKGEASPLTRWTRYRG